MAHTFIPAVGWYALIGVAHEEGDEPTAEAREIIAWECMSEKGEEKFTGEATGLVMDADRRAVVGVGLLRLENDGEWLLRYSRNPGELALPTFAKELAESYEREVGYSKARVAREERQAARRGGL